MPGSALPWTIYGSQQAYDQARFNTIAPLENAPLYNGTDASAGDYGFLNTPHTVGYGYDFSKHSGSQIISDLATAGISASDLTADQISSLQAYTVAGSAHQSYDAPAGVG